MATTAHRVDHWRKILWPTAEIFLLTMAHMLPAPAVAASSSSRMASLQMKAQTRQAAVAAQTSSCRGPPLPVNSMILRARPVHSVRKALAAAMISSNQAAHPVQPGSLHQNHPVDE